MVTSKKFLYNCWEIFLSLSSKWQIIYKNYSYGPSNSLEYTLRSRFEKSSARFFNCSPVSFKETSHTYFFSRDAIGLRISATVKNMFSQAFCFNLSIVIRHSHRFCDILILLNKHHLGLGLEKCQSELKLCQLC